MHARVCVCVCVCVLAGDVRPNYPNSFLYLSIYVCIYVISHCFGLTDYYCFYTRFCQLPLAIG